MDLVETVIYRGLKGCCYVGVSYPCIGASLVAQLVKNLPAMPETWLQLCVQCLV